MAIMRYKKGSIVEVLTNSEVPYGAWHCAEIISGNGHNYMVRYDVYPGVTDKAVVERVSRKSIRPSPPPLELSEDWIPGDVVEVFHNLSWKMAKVSKALDRNKFLVRLVGSFQEFQVSKSDMRVRQSWQDDDWIVIGKVSRNFEDGKCNELSALKYTKSTSSQVKQSGAKLSFRVKDHCRAAQNDINLLESRIVSYRTLKRGLPDCYSHVEANEGTAKKFRVAEKEGRRLRVLATSPDKVDAVATTREMLGVNHMHISFDNRATRYSEKNVEREKPNGAFGCSHVISLEPNDADSVTCSVGSCSITSYNPYEFSFQSGPVEETGSRSDAESVCQLEYQEGSAYPPTNEELAAEIHRLELHAYRCTMEALHASGPLSWEKETLVTELRMSLHISNDEHLMEIRNLVSAATPNR